MIVQAGNRHITKVVKKGQLNARLPQEECLSPLQGGGGCRLHGTRAPSPRVRLLCLGPPSDKGSPNQGPGGKTGDGTAQRALCALGLQQVPLRLKRYVPDRDDLTAGVASALNSQDGLPPVPHVQDASRHGGHAVHHCWFPTPMPSTTTTPSPSARWTAHH